MIPVFNCDELLEECLKSVLIQDAGEEMMQIEVVDDCSTKGNPEHVVNEVGKGRVHFYKKEKNEGAIANFNTCIERSKGELVHILHGDDYIENGFYQAISNAVDSFPEIALYATRSKFVNQLGIEIGVSNRRSGYEISPSDELSIFWEENPIQFAGIVVRKTFYDQVGNFDLNLIHTADWDMWARLFNAGKGIILNELLSNYRIFEGNDSAKLYRTAGNLYDIIRLRDKFKSYPNFENNLFTQSLLTRAKHQIENFDAKDDRDALLSNINFIVKYGSLKDTFFYKFKYYKKYLLGING
jgi:glycosyltransferase involved in cell wall biosynthesis